MKYKVVEMKELTKEILKEMLTEAYENGYRDGEKAGQTSSSWCIRNSFAQNPCSITLSGKKERKVEVGMNDSITNCPNITCSNSTETTNVKSINNAVHASVAHQNNTITGYQPRTSMFKANIIPPKGIKCEDV